MQVISIIYVEAFYFVLLSELVLASSAKVFYIYIVDAFVEDMA